MNDNYSKQDTCARYLEKMTYGMMRYPATISLGYIMMAPQPSRESQSFLMQKGTACRPKVGGYRRTLLQLPINFSRNDRNVGGRLGLQHGFGRLAAPCQAGHSDMEGGRPPSPAQAVAGTPVRYPYLSHILIPMYLKNVSQLISIILNTYPNYPTYLVIYPTYPLHTHLSATYLCSG
jgi:hypothetical protein